eukprot:m.345491 g.345491  ORF g.345491 m.345491 type:complete len:110 (-) comp26542_c0_seq1:1207-1536(-)
MTGPTQPTVKFVFPMKLWRARFKPAASSKQFCVERRTSSSPTSTSEQVRSPAALGLHSTAICVKMDDWHPQASVPASSRKKINCSQSDSRSWDTFEPCDTRCGCHTGCK